MHPLSHLSRSAHSLGAVLAALALGALAPAAASAATATATGTLLPGGLSLTTVAAPVFGATLDGTDQTASYTVPTTLTDARGTAAGWNLTITSTQFSTGGATPSALPTDASTITSVSNSCVLLVTCTSPSNLLTYPVAVPAGAGPPTAVKYFNAATGTGTGTFTNTPTIRVAIPANATAGVYSSTLTLAAVSGP